MSKRSLFNEIQSGLRDYASNPDALPRHAFPDPDRKAIRQSLELTQAEDGCTDARQFAHVAELEQQHRTPTGPVKAFLRVLEAEPEAVFRAMRPPR